MPITRHHSGQWIFQLRRTVAGNRIRVNKLLPKGWTRAEAEKFDTAETARQIALASGVITEQRLIEEAVLLYLQQHAPSLKNRADIEGAFLILHPYFAGRPLSELADVAREVMLEMRAAPGTIRNRLSYLRSACRWAWRHHKLCEHDPAERMILPKVRNARQVYLGRADMLRIARAMGLTWARDVMRVAFYTGMRAGEILRSQPVQQSSGEFALLVADSKNGQPRTVPVHPRVAHLIRGDWPPPLTVWTASKATKAAMRAVGLGHARLHDLRHSAASEMVNAGVDLFTVGRVLGHKSTVSTARYAHLAQERLREAVGTIGRKVQPKPEAKAA